MTREELIQAALDDLERRGIIQVSINERNEKEYHFPDDPVESLRLLKESRMGGQ
jgi:hypothetical protein